MHLDPKQDSFHFLGSICFVFSWSSFFFYGKSSYSLSSRVHLILILGSDILLRRKPLERGNLDENELRPLPLSQTGKKTNLLCFVLFFSRFACVVCGKISASGFSFFL